MKSAIILLAALRCGANAAWLRWSLDSGPVRSPQETSIAAADNNHAGWTPKPTQAPGDKPEGEVVLHLLQRQDSTTTWTNSETCGWFAGISSSAVECGGGFKCETNTDHVVACVSATISDFYSACLDYSAHLAGSCDNLGPKTGCCTGSDVPACGTYLWTSKPERSMYKCFETASVLTILDVPQFVIDASLASKSRAMTQTSSDSNGTPVTPTDGSPPTAPAADPGNAQSDPSSGGGNSSNTINIGAIVGGVLGGVAALALIIGCIVFMLCRRRKKSKSRSSSSKEKTTNVTSEHHHHTKEVVRDNNNNTDTHYIDTHTAEPLQAPAPVKESSTTSSSPNARSSRDARREARRARSGRSTAGAGGSGSGQQEQQQQQGSVSVSYTLNNSSHTATFARQPSSRGSASSQAAIATRTTATTPSPPGPEMRRPAGSRRVGRGSRGSGRGRDRGGRHSSSEDEDYGGEGEGAAYDEVYGEYHHHQRARGRNRDRDRDDEEEDRDRGRNGQQGGGGFVGGPSWRQSL